jgi:hypothetical protein
MIQAITRFSFVTGGLLGGYAVTQLVNWQNELGVPQYYVIFLFIILGGSIGFVLGGIVGRELMLWWRRAEQQVREIASPQPPVALDYRDRAADAHLRLHRSQHRALETP